MSKANDYWRKREEEALQSYITDEREYDRQVKKIYADMLDACQQEIDSFYGKYAAKEGISIAEAQRRVSRLDIEAYERKAKRYVEEKNFSDLANKEMRLYNATMRINRLEMLKANIGLELISGHDKLEKFMSKILHGRTNDELSRQAGILGKSIRGNAKTVDNIVNASFHNATFSQRVWGSQSLLKNKLSSMLQTGLIQGKNPRALARELQKAFGASVYDSERLMRTELARVQTDAQKKSFEANEYDEYEFIANGGCCSVCQGLNGKHFEVKKMMPGENAAPLHPNCRCSVAAYVDDKEYEEWLNYLDKGGTTAEWNKLKGKTKESVAKAGRNGTIRSGAVSGALNPNSREAQKHADQYYESVRHMKNDTATIADNIGWQKETVEKIKKYVFIDEHELLEGRARFAPSYDMAQSWQRLIDGKHIKEQDLVLLKHEYLELELVEKGMSQDAAHIEASKKYNYAKYLE